MASIRLLDESIAQKIAAGEVVERPASVVKELVENSVDAGSTFVTVEIAEGGAAYLRVTDNGCGIPAGEVELAFLRHATSKIQTLDDLYNIRQMGFRGEALYSVAAVSRLELTTKPAAQPSGVRLTMEGGRQTSLTEFGCPDGTTIVVRDLFYNTPARLKFMNKPGAEAAYVGTAVTRLLLANPGVSIKFVNNGRVLCQSAGDGSLKNAIYTVYGREIAQGLIHVESSDGPISVRGYLFAPESARGNRGYQLLLVNGRPVMHSAVSAVVERLFAGFTEARRYPGFVLQVDLPPEFVDVNVHPNKLQVRFANEFRVRHVVESAVSVAMERVRARPVAWAFQEEGRRAADEAGGEGRAPAAPSGTDGAVQAERTPPPGDAVPPPGAPRQEEPAAVHAAVTVDETVGRFTESVRMAMVRAFGSAGAPEPSSRLMQRPGIPAAPEQPQQEKLGGSPAARMIGQAFDTYALLEYEDKLLIIDQHAAHERLLYEKYVKAAESAGTLAQRLLIPQVVNVSHEVKAVLDENMELLASLGFELEEYGKLSYRVNTVPHILGQPQMRDILFDIVEILSDERTVRTDEIKREKLMSMACKRAVKGGDRLSVNELAALVSIVAAEGVPLTCPHGRPFVIVLEKHSMEKQFKRVK